MDPNQLELIFEKDLKKTDIENRLAYPVELIPRVWAPNDPLKKRFYVTDLSGASWNLEGNLRFNDKGNPKPEVYGREWKRFVLTKRPRVGDVLVFSRHPDPTSRAVFVLSIKKEITLMGATFPAHI